MVLLYWPLFYIVTSASDSWRRLCNWYGLYVCLWAALLRKWWADFIEAWRRDRAYQSEELINFWWCSDPKYRFWNTLPLPSPCGIGPFRSFISMSPTITHRPLFTRNSVKWPGMNPLHFGSYPAYSRIWINLDLNHWLLLVRVSAKWLSLSEIFCVWGHLVIV